MNFIKKMMEKARQNRARKEAELDAIIAKYEFLNGTGSYANYVAQLIDINENFVDAK